MSAEERRESVIRAALVEFARTGYHGTSTEAIARRVGVSQPYLFRLFPGKLALFLAVAERCFDRIIDAFEEAADGLHGDEALQAMANAYSELIRDRSVLLLQMQLYVAAASSESPELGAAVRRRWIELWETVRARSGVEDEQMKNFFGGGMLINVLLAIGLPGSHPCWGGFDGECKQIALEELPATT